MYENEHIKRYPLLILIWFLFLPMTGCNSEPTWSDYDGGVQLLIRVLPENNVKLASNNTEIVSNIIFNRLNDFGVHKKLIAIRDNNKIAIQIAPYNQMKRIVNFIAKPGQIEFRLVEEEPINRPDGVEALVLTNRGKRLYVKKKPLMDNIAFADVKPQIGMDSDEPYLLVEFDSDGKKQFKKITSENINQRLAIVIDNEIHSAPVIQKEISNGLAVITGLRSMAEAADLSILLKHGAYPTQIELVEIKHLSYENWLGKN